MRVSYVYPASWAVSWILVTTLAGLAAWTAAVFRMSREYSQPGRLESDGVRRHPEERKNSSGCHAAQR
jgi:hypothetical protein